MSFDSYPPIEPYDWQQNYSMNEDAGLVDVPVSQQDDTDVSSQDQGAQFDSSSPHFEAQVPQFGAAVPIYPRQQPENLWSAQETDLMSFDSYPELEPHDWQQNYFVNEDAGLVDIPVSRQDDTDVSSQDLFDSSSLPFAAQVLQFGASVPVYAWQQPENLLSAQRYDLMPLDSQLQSLDWQQNHPANGDGGLVDVSIPRQDGVDASSKPENQGAQLNSSSLPFAAQVPQISASVPIYDLQQPEYRLPGQRDVFMSFGSYPRPHYWQQNDSVNKDAGLVDVPIPRQDYASSQDQGAQLDNSTPPLRCPKCRKDFKRKQELERHIRSYLPHFLFCPFPRCPWRGNRQVNLTTHWQEKHEYCGLDPMQQKSQIYCPNELVTSVLRGDLTVEKAASIALSVVANKAGELDKRDVWEDNWGRRTRNRQ